MRSISSERRLREHGVSVQEAAPRFAEQALACTDPSGLVLELVAGPADDRPPWVTNEVAARHAIRGLYSVALPIRDPRATLQLLTEVLGFEVVEENASRTPVAVNGDLPGRFMDVLPAPTW